MKSLCKYTAHIIKVVINIMITIAVNTYITVETLHIDQ